MIIRRITERLSAMIGSLFLASAGGDSRPVFFDIGKTYPLLDFVTSRSALIRAELETLLAERSHIPRYHDVDGYQEMISGTENGSEWRVFMLCGFGESIASNAARCPNTMEILERVPNVVQAFFSILEPGKSVPVHQGPMAGLLRYHLGLKVPIINPPVFRVHNVQYTWQEGDAILFDDTWNHEVINKSNDIRVVLIVDILRPMPVLLHTMNWLYIFLGARLYYLHGILLPNLKRLAAH